ncbi:MAG: hypothetical protein A49_09020 [Methyloceanibacter sp.]|nr:MAG: hypothetical protein A49_09020 [Methyloceanibacter sp.]
MNLDGAEAVVQEALDFLSDSSGPVAIHAGHFMLVAKGDTCAPTVAIDSGTEPIDSNGNPLRHRLSQFTLETWRLGATLAAELRASDRQAELLTLVNDWQYLRSSTLPNANTLRHEFYASNPKPFASFMTILEHVGLDETAIMTLGRWNPFVSESWLRRRIERRFKRLIATDDRLATRLAVQRHFDGSQCLVFDDFGRACRLLVCGQSDCAGEVMELIYMLYEQGYRRLVNFIPKECETPVNEGTRRAIALFRLGDFAALNIALPCIAAGCSPNGAAASPSNSRVFADPPPGPGGEIEAVVEYLHKKVG